MGIQSKMSFYMFQTPFMVLLAMENMLVLYS